MAVTLGPNGIIMPTSSNPQTNLEGIVKIGIGVGTKDFVSGTGFTPAGYQYAGFEVDMGTPEKSTNWYQIRYQTICDDPAAGRHGTGAGIWRWTPSAGWGQVASQGQHATLESDVGDLYWMCNMYNITSTHPTYPTEPHRFRIYHANWVAGTRINAGIGRQVRNGNWENGFLEVFEMDSGAMHSGALTRY